jgi:ornithine cyclodeaminase/alanine dehydrogenase-like protein (mu-crystallin family)
LFGAGWQAESQLLAIDAVRKLDRVWIVNRNADRCAAFIARMQPLVKAKLEGGKAPEEAVRSSQIVTTITTSREPVLKGEWLQPGTHINAAGGNLLLRREIDDNVVVRANRLVVDSVEQCRIESGEFLAAIETGRRHWEDFVELRNVVAGFAPGRVSSSDITLFKSGGVALEDVAIGKLVFERAREKGVGRTLDL